MKKILVHAGAVSVAVLLVVVLINAGVIMSPPPQGGALTAVQSDDATGPQGEASAGAKELQAEPQQPQRSGDVWAELGELHKFVADVGASINAMRDDMEFLKSSMDASNVVVSEIMELISTQIPMMKNRIADLEIRIDTTETEVGMIKDLRSQVETLRQEISSLERELQELRVSKVPDSTRLIPTEESEPAEEMANEEAVEESSVVEEHPSVDFANLVLSISRTQYTAGETAVININTDRYADVMVSIVSGDSTEIFSKELKADAAGRIRVEYSIEPDMQAGGYTVKAMLGGNEKSLSFTVVKSTTLPISYAELGRVTLESDKQTYRKGDYMSLSGFADPGSRVMITMMTSSGNESVFFVQPNRDGIYHRLTTISLDSSGGEWIVTAKQGDKVAMLSITVL